MRKVPSAALQHPSALDELLAAEQEIAVRAADAEREAESTLAAARTDAASYARDAAEALVLEMAQLDERARLGREALVCTIEEEAARTVQRYRSLTDTEVASLAAFAIADATGLEPEGAP